MSRRLLICLLIISAVGTGGCLGVKTVYPGPEAMVMTDVQEKMFTRNIYVDGEDVYVAGMDIAEGLLNAVPCYWKNGERVLLSEEKGNATLIRSVNGSVYVAGGYAGDFDEGTPFYWKDGSFSPLGEFGDEPTDMEVIGEDVFISGVHGTGRKKEHTPGYWKNGQWTAFDGQGDTHAIFIDGTDVYVGGAVKPTRSSRRPGYWKNSQWVELTGSEGNNNENGTVNDLVVKDGKVIAVGEWDAKAALWEDGKYTELKANYATDIHVYDGHKVILGHYPKPNQQGVVRFLWVDDAQYTLYRKQGLDATGFFARGNTVYVSIDKLSFASAVGAFWQIDITKLPPIPAK